MKTNGIHFSFEEFNRIFPFFILLDEKLNILSHGDSISKIIPDFSNQSFAKIFKAERPILKTIDFESLKTICGELLIMEALQPTPIKLRGQLEFISEKNQILFVGAPWFESTEQMASSALILKDYAPHSPLFDLLHMLKTQEIVNKELKDVLQITHKQKKELETANLEIKNISASLEESIIRYEYVNKATSEAIWDWDIITGKVYYGEGINKLFGHDIHKFSNNINIWGENIHPEDHQRIFNEIHEAIDGAANNWSGEYRYLKSDGSYAIVKDQSFIVRDEFGYAIRMVGAMKDVSSQKEEETHLKLLESVITNTNDSVMITEANPDHKIIYVNEAFSRMTGYTAEEVIGKTPKMFQGPNTDRTILENMKASISNWQTFEATLINYKKNGEEFWLNLSITPIENEKGEYTHWISIERDVTLIKRAEEDLTNQKKFTEDILNNIPADIAVFSPNHNYLFLNPNAIKNEEVRKWMIGKNDFDYTTMKNSDDTIAKKRWALFEKAIDEMRTIQWEDEHKSADGTQRYILRNFYPYFEDNKLKYMIGYGIDITERKQIEIKLSEALENIQKSNSELEQFAYVASHDLQEPLRMVTSFLSQLEKKYGQSLDDKAKEYIFFAVDGAKRMRQIILDLLEFSRVGRTNESIKDIDLNEIVDEVKVLHSKQVEELHAKIISENLPSIKYYKTPMRQLFQNLIGNSLKYHRKDVPPVINISATDKIEEWEFCIKDNGIGIDNQFFDKIFTIFQRLHNKDEYSGTGIGLAITKKIIDNMGGKIWVESELNNGSSFYFTLPKQNQIQ